MSAVNIESTVSAHYGNTGMLERVQAALRDAGKADGTLTTDDLALLDQLHTGGRTSSRALAELAGVSAGTRIVDLGGGAGGPARTLAHEFGCDVTVVDISPGLVALGEYLTERTGLTDRVRFVSGSALAIPVQDAAFDLAWTQHAQMNIADKPRLYREVARVLRPGGRFAFHEIFAGKSGEPDYPLPWATEPGYSFLPPPDDVRAELRAAGLREVAWHDVTGEGISWFRRALATPVEQVPTLALHLLVGPLFPTMTRNCMAGFENGSLVVVSAVWERPA